MVLQRMEIEGLFLGLDNIFRHICIHKFNFMGLRIRFSLLIFCSLSVNLLLAQNSGHQIIAKNGDGIFSVLRNRGMNPVKYYADFLTLNEKNIRNGSELIVGVTYYLPDAPDSFVNMGTKINVVKSDEQPIFDSALGKMRLKDSTLNNSVYHLIYAKELRQSNNSLSTPDLMLQLTNDLLVRGAKVYIYEKEISENVEETDGDSIAFKKQELGSFVSAVNKKYLMNSGSYQRLLLVQEKSTEGKGPGVSVHHFDASNEDKKLAASLRDTFKENWEGSVVVDEDISPLKDEAVVYFANNVLPSVTTLDLNFDISKKGGKVKAIKNDLAKLITSGILKDYSKTDFSD